MFNLFSQKLDGFGLDISEASLKIAKLEERKGELILSSFGDFEVPEDVMSQGRIKNAFKLSNIIKKSMNNASGDSLRSEYVNLSLPEQESFVDIFEMPLIEDEEELESAVRYEAENHIPVPIHDVYFDFQKIREVGNGEKYNEVLIDACPKEVVDPYIEAAKKAGLKIKSLETECLSITRTLIKKGEVTAPRLLIDFGGNSTIIMIYAGRSLRFTSTVAVSSSDITKSISDNLKIDFEQAEEKKKKYGLKGDPDLFDAMIPPLTDLVEQIKKYLEYYRSHERQESVKKEKLEKIMICGGGANLRGLVEFLESHISGIKVEVGNPWINVRPEKKESAPELSFKKWLNYTTAIGLALRGAGSEPDSSLEAKK